MHKMIYVVASEQIYHFKALFEILGLLGYKFVKDYYHLPYGMIHLPEGKMKSREGRVVDADNLMRGMVDLAKEEILKRGKRIGKKELDKRAEAIGLGAIKFFILKYDPLKDFTYNTTESLSFEGETGPYIQYAHARISSILAKVKTKTTKKTKGLKEPEELKIIKLLSEYPEIVQEAANQHKPSLIANYLFDLAQSFNTFYSRCPILKADKNMNGARLNLVTCVRTVLKDGLNLLGVDALERM